MVMGAMPMPAETSDTARLRWVSNQPVTQAIMGAKIAAQASPTTIPNRNWNAIRLVVRLAKARPAASSTDPAITTGLGPKRSDRLPQAMLPTAMARKPTVMALETAVTDQPVSLAMKRRNTGSENMAPMATQPSKPPAATITQR